MDDVVLVLDDSGSLISRELHGPGFDHILASEFFSPTTAGELPLAPGDLYWALADNQGTVRDLAEYDALLNETNIVNHIEYDSFGNIIDESATAADYLLANFRYSYTGQDYDADADLLYYLNRWYSARIGSFVSKDPIGFAAGDTNLKRYVGNSPTNGTDPSGLLTRGPGHHWVPFSLFDPGSAIRLGNFQPDVQSFLNGGEALLDTSVYHHGNDTWNKISHHKYNSLVREEFGKFVKLKGGAAAFTEADARQFVKWVENGTACPRFPGANTANWKSIRSYVSGIKQSVLNATAAQLAGVTDEGDLKRIAKALNGQATGEMNTKSAKAFIKSVATKGKSFLGPFLAKAGRMLPLLGLVGMASALMEGHAEAGVPGAMRAGARELVAADAVEALAEYGVEKCDEHLTKTFGNWNGKSRFSAYLEGEDVYDYIKNPELLEDTINARGEAGRALRARGQQLQP